MPSLGIGLGLTVSRRAAAAFTPALVSGYLGGVYAGPARSAGLLWQNSGETVQATADTDPVYVAGDLYSATEFASDSDAHRLILTAESGGKWSFKGNGTSSVLLTGMSDLAGEFCIYLAAVGAGSGNLPIFAAAADDDYVGWYADGRFYLVVSSNDNINILAIPSSGIYRIRRDAANICYYRVGTDSEQIVGTKAGTISIGSFMARPGGGAPAFAATGNHVCGVGLYSSTPSAENDALLMAYFGGLL